MANPFFVQSPQYGQAFNQAAQGVQRFGQQQKEEQRRAEAEAYKQEAKQAMATAFQSGDPAAIRQAVINYPEIAETATQMFGFTNEQTEKVARETYRRALSEPDPQKRAAILEGGIETVSQFGGNPRMMAADLQTLRENPEAFDRSARAGYAALASDQEYQAMFPESGAGQPAGVRQFESMVKAAGLEPGTEEYQQAALISLGLQPRAGISASERIANDPELAARVAALEEQTTAASERGKLETQEEIKPRVEAAVDRAKAEVAQAVKAEGEQRSNARTLAIYDSAMSNLANALSETTTAPGVGWVPAMTANAQIAEGAQAVMAPILKSMFRTAGEGTFTDQDQKMLMDMIPTRSDLPEARAAKIQAIDAVVRAKLGASQSEEPAPAESGSKQSTRIKLDAEGNIIQ